MMIVVSFRGFEASDSLRKQIVRRVRLELDRFAADVSSVVVRLRDMNGPKGGVDKRCHVTVHGRSISPVRIDAVSSDARSALESAMERAARSVAREVERTRWSRDDDFGRAS